MRYFDSHAHYYDDRFVLDDGEPVERLLSDLFENSVSYVVNVGTSPTTSRLAIEQAKQFPRMVTAVGIHPTDCQEIDDLSFALREIEELAQTPENKCVAIGEIGLDYHYPDTQKERQIDVFKRQMAMAERLSLPVIIHDRDAHGDVMNVLHQFPNVHGVVHSFSGSPEMAKEAVKLGYYVSFSGTVTFTNAKKVVEAAAVVPYEKLLIETDAPYLAPHPLRGTKNHSGNLVYTCRKIAEILGVSEEDAAHLTAKNAATLFHMSFTE